MSQFADGDIGGGDVTYAGAWTGVCIGDAGINVAACGGGGYQNPCEKFGSETNTT